jgi:uncharacterized protein YuzE
MDANAAYVKLRTGRVVKTEESRMDSLDISLDYNKAGDVIRLEVLNLKELLKLYLVPKIVESGFTLARETDSR